MPGENNAPINELPQEFSDAQEMKLIEFYLFTFDKNGEELWGPLYQKMLHIKQERNMTDEEYKNYLNNEMIGTRRRIEHYLRQKNLI